MSDVLSRFTDNHSKPVQPNARQNEALGNALRSVADTSSHDDVRNSSANSITHNTELCTTQKIWLAQIKDAIRHIETDAICPDLVLTMRTIQAHRVRSYTCLLLDPH